MKIENINVDEIKFDSNNAREHDQKNLEAIQGSLESFGQRKPIVIDTQNVVVAGNGTLEAAVLLGWKEIQCVRVPEDWTADQIKAFALADNRTAELASWDQKVLSAQLLELDQAEFDIEAIGFELPQEVEMEEINAEEIPDDVESRSKSGDLWQLGNHKLYVGDALNDNSYQELMQEELADMVWTDPPYGVNYVGKTKDALTIQNDQLDVTGLESFLRDAFTNMYSFSKPGCVWYVASPSGSPLFGFLAPLNDLGVWRHTLVWVKDTLVMGRADYHYRHELLLYGWKEGAAHQEPPNRKQDTVWEIARPKANKEHPTMKPLELITRSIQNSSRVNDIVLDSFAGSGSTLLACEQTKRHARVIELDPKYADVILSRWEQISGGKAVLLNGAEGQTSSSD